MIYLKLFLNFFMIGTLLLVADHGMTSLVLGYGTVQ